MTTLDRPVPRQVRVAVTQFECDRDLKVNLERATRLVREAAAQGAQIILLQELFLTLYFCQEQSPDYFAWAQSEENSPLLIHFASLARELNVVLPISYFEKANQAFYNAVVVIDADGSFLGRYRKSHIPDGAGYQEKFYFTPGDTGFKVFKTHYGRIGVGICWDQWFPEAARAMVLQGAEILLYPTAIGSEPGVATAHVDSQPHWQRAMVGHAAANMVPVLASNRIGREVIRTDGTSISFYGTSFVCDHRGDMLVQADRGTTGVSLADLDLASIEYDRNAWGLFRDRRPDLYSVLLTKDGTKPV
jgi:N-carbamoylputrescine amidase